MQIGYMRISTDDQHLDLQRDALKKAGCEKIYEDIKSGAIADRPGLRATLENLREGDTLVVWRLDRLGRSMKDLIELITLLESRKIGIKFLQENIDTSSSAGKLFFHIFGAFAEFERNLIRERTNAGLMAARARGRKGGRPKKLDENKHARALKLYASKEHSILDICEMLQVSKPTLYKYLKSSPSNKAIVTK